MFPLDKIERIELEESKKTAYNSFENSMLQKNKLKFSHPYDKIFLLFLYEI